jgi:hypothetical protein
VWDTLFEGVDEPSTLHHMVQQRWDTQFGRQKTGIHVVTLISHMRANMKSWYHL